MSLTDSARIYPQRLFLRPFSGLFAAVVYLRNRFYDWGVLRARRLPVPVISVGNLSAGGTGKTPLVLSLAKMLRDPPYQKAPAVLSRGYRRKSTGYQLVSAGEGPLCSWEVSGDEPQLMARKLSRVPVAVDRDRVRGGQALMGAFSLRVILLDDAFQYRRLRRDLDIVLLDAQRDLNDSLLPLGLLREPLSALKRAHLILLCSQSDAKTHFDEAWRTGSSFFGAERLAAFRTKPSGCFDLRSGESVPTSALSGKRIIPFCGIAKPAGFLKTLEEVGADFPYLIRFPDHHHYKPADVERLAQAYVRHQAHFLITTEKDAVKLGGLFVALPILVLQIEIEWLRGLENLRRELNRLFPANSENRI